ncbi:MAG: N-acetylmuramoyl-L-alanine amidase [Acidobacteriota bacterium]|nr:N-acetylmuramoyl-L-alanine amidase [Acidobacteriota bacterium]
MSPSLARKVFPVENGFLERIRVAQFKPGITRLVLDVPQIEDYSVFSLPNPFRLVIDIHGVQQPLTAQAGNSGSFDHGHKDLSDKIRPGSEGRGIGNSLSASANQSPREGQPDGLSNSARRSSTRYQATETPERTPAQPGASLNAPAATNLPPTLTRALGLKIRRIVIDPGHGGKDTGTIGPTGLEEKNVVLDIGLRLRKLIERRMSCQVIMTRSTDVFIPLEERTAIANEYGADLFISIHANASHDPAARGVETYYLNFTSDPQALQLAARENASSEDSVYQLQSLIKKIALSEKIDESRRFARVVDYQLAGYLDRSGDVQKNRGVKKAPFVVLIGASMPSILAEISFLSNPHDERLLRKASFREKIAVGLYDGIARYARSLGAVRVAEREPSLSNQPSRAARPDATGQHSAPSF